ncbi:hypothetical protein [Sphingobium fluviale]|uniref:DUF4156 domain-containing protein n=1 Tax=Sphingobium fluviale TaxID=2506423 RepID=A0A4Q1KFV6_9SPHN|nr:hypothetical protein [Sphingobium fluviale]RXR27258.1 hypothetical protein EQG66_12365 [Sphingobium fluviale]
MRFLAIFFVIGLLSTAVKAAEKPLPDGIKIIAVDQASTCQFLDIVSAMKFAMVSASKTSRAALIAALEKAKAKGADSAVITATTVSNNQHQYTLNAYRCERSANEVQK